MDKDSTSPCPISYGMNTFSITEAIKYGWSMFKQHYTLLAGLVLTVFAVGMGLDFISRGLSETSSLASFVLSLIGTAISIFVGIGIIYIALRLHDENTAKFKDIFKAVPFFWRYIGTSIAYAVTVLVGLILLIVPGIYWAIKYSFYKYMLIDKNLGPIEALKESGKITHGAKWNLLLFFIVIMILNIIGILAMGVGLLISMPVTLMATVYVYRKLLKRGGITSGETPEIKNVDESPAVV